MEPENEPNYFDRFADEVLLEVLKNLPQRELSKLALLSCRFRRIVEDRTLWKNVLMAKSRNNRNAVLVPLGTLMRRQVQQLTVMYLTMPPLDGKQSSWSLKELNLSNVQICADDLAQMFNLCQQLTKVGLEHMSMKNDALVALSGNKNLEILHLIWPQDLEPHGLEVLLQNVTKLEQLCIDGYYLKRSSLILNTTCENLPPSLLRLTLISCYALEDEHIEKIVRKCPLLQLLHVTSIFSLELTSRSIEFLLKLKNLRILKIPECLHIPVGALLPLTKMENLEKLNICNGPRNREQRRSIEELFGINVTESGNGHNRDVHVGSFQSEFRIVKIRY